MNQVALAELQALTVSPGQGPVGGRRTTARPNAHQQKLRTAFPYESAGVPVFCGQRGERVREHGHVGRRR
jgi:hypothetical protein